MAIRLRDMRIIAVGPLTEPMAGHFPRPWEILQVPVGASQGQSFPEGRSSGQDRLEVAYPIHLAN